MDIKKNSSSAAPILDNIETSCHDEIIPPLNNINGSELSALSNLSTDCVDNLAYYKRLSDNISRCLFLHASPLLDDSCTKGVNPLGDAAYKLQVCGSQVGFDDAGRVVTANFCRLRVCPLCQKRRSLKVAAEFNRIMEYLSCSWLHLVLTVPNCSADELSNLLDTMQICSSRLFNVAIIKRAFKGVARCTEITYNFHADTYHPHFHCLVAVNKSYFTSRYYIQALTIRKLWTVICNAAFRGVNVRKKSDDWFFEQCEIMDDIVYQCHITKADSQAVAEIAKYSVKPLEIGLQGVALYEPLKTIYFALHSRRLIQTYGIIKDAAKILRVDFDTIEDDDELDKNKITLYTWDRSLSSYKPLSCS